MYKKKPVFLTDSKGGIYKIEKLIKAAVLKNLETNERITVEHPLTGFAIINMPKVDAVLDEQTDSSGIVTKNDKSQKNQKKKSSQYFGVSFCKQSKKNPWRGGLWLDGKNISVGGFKMDIEAAKAVDAKLVERGLPKRNFP